LPTRLTDILPSETVGKLGKYVEIASEVARKFREAVELLNRYQVGDARRVFAELVKLDNEGERLRSELESEISSLRLEASFLSELLVFVSSIDRISDHVKEVAKEFRVLPFLEIPQEVRDGLLELCKVVGEAVETYNKAFKAVVDGRYEEALGLVGKVIDLEEKADDIEVRNRGLILEAGDKFKPFAMAILVHSLNKALEDTADISALSASNLRILIVTRLLYT